MKIKSLQIILACVAILASASWANAQTLTGNPYDTFDRGTSITASVVVTPNSVRQYTIPGDATTTASTFVWQIKGGVFVTDAEGTTNASGTTAVGLPADNSSLYTLIGDGSNQSVVYVKWDNVDDDSYVAVYEETSYGCYNSEAPFRGFQVSALNQLDIWLTDAAQADICSGDVGTVRIELPANSGDNANNYYPMTVNYSVTDKNGTAITGSPFELTLETTNVVVGADTEAGRYFYTIDRGNLTVGTVTTDDYYTITLESVTDAYNAAGNISDVAGDNKYPSHRIDVRHLPQTNVMTQN